MQDIPTSRQLVRALKIRTRLQKLESQLTSLLGGEVGNGMVAKRIGHRRRKKRRISAAGPAAIAAAQRKRWRQAKRAGKNL